MAAPFPAGLARAGGFAKRALVWTHRWMGIVLGLLAVVWFASGIAMIYVGGMPRLTPQQRVDHLPVLDLAAVRLTPAQAAARLEDSAGLQPGVPELTTIQGRPAWRFPARNEAMFADDGSEPGQLDEAGATDLARAFLREPAPGLRLLETLQEPDQWTLSLRGAMPLLKFAAGDARGTELYVSMRRGEVVQVTTRAARAKAWIATIPHWLYFSALRQNQPLWYRVVVWTSALVCVLVALGLVLAFTQWRRTRPFDLARAIPYRGGMRWHYISGALFGVFALTWAFSGLLSMEPFAWTNVPEVSVDSARLGGGEPDLARYDTDLTALPGLVAPRQIKEISLARIHDGHYLRLHTSAPVAASQLPQQRPHQPYGVAGRSQDDVVLVDIATLTRHDQPFATGAILERLQQSLPVGVTLEKAQHELLQDYDNYYYSRSGEAPLPVLRVKLGDALDTWLYIDSRTSQLVANVHRYSRIERWLYNGLHSLDFRFWYSKRPLWDLVMITLLLGGLVGSAIGLFYGVRRQLR